MYVLLGENLSKKEHFNISGKDKSYEYLEKYLKMGFNN